jgi:hypothetical protein
LWSTVLTPLAQLFLPKYPMSPGILGKCIIKLHARVMSHTKSFLFTSRTVGVVALCQKDD